jgi:hypothetical protein
MLVWMSFYFIDGVERILLFVTDHDSEIRTHSLSSSFAIYSLIIPQNVIGVNVSAIRLSPVPKGR